MKKPFLLLVFAMFLSGCTAIELVADLGKRVGRLGGDTVDTGGVIGGGGEARSYQGQARYKVGDPYQIRGVWYYPERNLSYDETGIASWYGDAFAGKPTANGEIFDPELVSAAHKTLPMPSVVRVTNLDNGRALVIRINDRGPFVAGRIIDLSREAARLLGFQRQGLARVRVQILAEQSLRLEREARNGRFPLLGENDTTPRPETTAAAVPTVSLTSTSSVADTKTSPDNSVSALGLLAQSRSTAVLELAPVDTDIWVQVGAFSTLETAQTLANRLNGVGDVKIIPLERTEGTLHRVRIGPIAQVAEADTALEKVIALGYTGARIVLE